MSRGTSDDWQRPSTLLRYSLTQRSTTATHRWFQCVRRENLTTSAWSDFICSSRHRYVSTFICNAKFFFHWLLRGTWLLIGARSHSKIALLILEAPSIAAWYDSNLRPARQLKCSQHFQLYTAALRENESHAFYYSASTQYQPHWLMLLLKHLPFSNDA